MQKKQPMAKGTAAFFRSSVLMVLSLPSMLLAGSCGNDGKEPDDAEVDPIVEISVSNVTHTTADFSFRTINTEKIYFLVLEGDKSSPSMQDIISNGVALPVSPYSAKSLIAGTQYNAFALPESKTGKHGSIQKLPFSTPVANDNLYSWERERTKLPDIADMVLCYGGSSHREKERWNSQWTKERFKPLVTYVDESGEEHWLFESFLALEFIDDANGGMPYWCGQKHWAEGQWYDQADRESWQRLIDYWFRKDNGFDALDQCVSEAIGRIGQPDSKRFVILSIPEPVIYQHYSNKASSTKYWGTLDGEVMDFSVADHRRRVEKWFIDEVRKRFDEANYRNIELVGFYIISEDIALGGVENQSEANGWSQDLKRNEEIYPWTCDYLHSCNEGMYWIPYYKAAPYKNARWKELHIDWAVMQPNHFWDAFNEKPFPNFFDMIEEADMGMELEFDDLLLEESRGQVDTNRSTSDKEVLVQPEFYRIRIREYLSWAKSKGVYGKRPFGVYHGDDAIYKLYASQDPEDQKIFHEICEFIMNNPARQH